MKRALQRNNAGLQQRKNRNNRNKLRKSCHDGCGEVGCCRKKRGWELLLEAEAITTISSLN